MANDELLKSVIALRDSYENKKNAAVAETEEAYKKGQWNHHTGMSYRSADYSGFVNSLNAILQSYEKER